jgi:hypothetical protein
MDFLQKSNSDNADKLSLFEKGQICSANFCKDQWFFIENDNARENIAYHVQYLEFCTALYNKYEIYLTVESLLCKNIISSIASIIECALFELVNRHGESANFNLDTRRDFLSRIDIAYDMQLIDEEMKDLFHALRKMRNKVHLSGAEEREYITYTVEDTNKYIGILEKFRQKLASEKE